MRIEFPTNRACFHNSVRGLVVMIVACQVMDPGSIPGERNFARSFSDALFCSRSMGNGHPCTGF